MSFGTYILAGIPATEVLDGDPRRPVPVTVESFVRAETDLYFGRTVKRGGFGRLVHTREMTDVYRQEVVRMNRDTLYSSGVFDLEAAPLAITLPDPGTRFMSMQAVSQDHFTLEVAYAPGRHEYTREGVGTRYLFILIRTLADPRDADDLRAARDLQDAIAVEQASAGWFEVPSWEAESRDAIRQALKLLGSFKGTGERFRTAAEVDPVGHLIGTATGWGGNPRSAATYASVFPRRNDGVTVHTLTVRDVPVDGFWSISVYNAGGFFERNPLDAYSLNDLTAEPGPDGSVTVRFGGCRGDTPNCLPIMPGWSYTVRLYRPRKEILDGRWTFPEARPER